MYGYWTVLISKLHLLALRFLSNKEGLPFEVCSGYFYYLPYGRTSLLYTCYLLEPYFIDSQWCVFYQLARIAATPNGRGPAALHESTFVYRTAGSVPSRSRHARALSEAATHPTRHSVSIVHRGRYASRSQITRRTTSAKAVRRGRLCGPGRQITIVHTQHATRGTLSPS
jgi:hypothetical protein